MGEKHIKLSDKNIIHKWNPNEICTICNMNESENISHFLFRCPLYNSIRSFFLAKYINYNVGDDGKTNLINILTKIDEQKLKNIYGYVVNALKIRSFIINE